MKRSEQIQQIIKRKEREKLEIERWSRRELKRKNKGIIRLTRELEAIRSGSMKDEEAKP